MGTSVAYRFRHPLGSGYLTESQSTTSYLGQDEGSYTDPATGSRYHGYYVSENFNERVTLHGNLTYHLGEDWNGAGGGNTDEGVAIFSIANGQVVQKGTNAGFGNYVVVRHDFPSAELTCSPICPRL